MENKEEKVEYLDEETKEDIKEELKKEIVNEKKHPFMITVIMIVLFCVFLGIGYALGGITTVHDVKNANVSGNTVNNGTKTTNDSLKEIDDDSLIDSLWNRVNFYGMLNINNFDELNYDGLKVSEMSDEMKGMLAAKYFTRTTSSNGTNKVKVYESDVRYGYDSLFGAGTYKSGQKIYGTCADYTYNSVYKTYESPEPACGGTSLAGIVEQIDKIEKSSSELKITSVLAFYHFDNNKLYKTYKDAVDDKDASEAFNGSDDEKIDDYLKKNKDSYNQYVYTFSIESNGFYKYIGYEKIK